MGGLPTSSLWLILGLPLLLLAVGVVLFIRAVRPRRIGDTPYCRRCRYNLTGLPRTRCPECGRDVSVAKAIVVGERHVRRAHVACAVVVLALGVVPLAIVGIAVVRNVSWCHFYPTSWVLDDLRNQDAAVVNRALSELDRRLNQNHLSAGEIATLADFCLAEQAAPKLRFPIGVTAIELLGKLYRGGVLDRGRAVAFLEHLVYIEMRVRPTLIVNNRSVVEFVVSERAPAAGPFYSGRIRLSDSGPDGSLREIVSQFGGLALGSLLSTYSYRKHVPVRTAGRHEIKAEIDFLVTSADLCVTGLARHEEPPSGTILHAYVCRFSQAVEAVCDMPPDFIQFVEGPELRRQVEEFARVTLRLCENRDNEARMLSLGFLRPELRSAPRGPAVPLAFDLYVKTASDETHVGTWLGGPNYNSADARGAAQVADGEKVWLLLRPNPLLAASTVDITEIWGGEIYLDSVGLVDERGNPVDAPPTSQPASATASDLPD